MQEKIIQRFLLWGALVPISNLGPADLLFEYRIYSQLSVITLLVAVVHYYLFDMRPWTIMWTKSCLKIIVLLIVNKRALWYIHKVFIGTLEEPSHC